MLNVTSNKLKKAENWSGTGPAFDNAPEIPGAGNPDLLETGNSQPQPITPSEVKKGDWVRVKPTYNDGSVDNRIGIVIETGKGRFGPDCIVYFPRGGGMTKATFSPEGLSVIPDEQIPPAYQDEELLQYIQRLRSQPGQ